jgi:membrane-associated phospholipid phosphatase
MSSGRLDRRARLLLGAAACFALTLALAVYVGRATSPPAVDRDVAQWVHEHRIDALDPAWRAVALLGGSAGLGAVVLASCVLAWRRLDRRWVTFLLASYIGAEVLFWSLKAVVDRPRPPVSLRLATAGSQSFPSGHTTVATAVGASLLIAATQIAEPRLRRVAMVALIALPLVIGLDRLALGVHWFTDVIGGLLLGLGWVLLCAALMSRVSAARPR